MAITIISAPVAAAVAAATDQTSQRAALLAPFGAADVTVRAVNGATLRDTVTYGPWVLDTNTPRGATLGALLARSVASTGAPTAFVFRAGSTDIFSVTAAVSPGSADIILPAISGGIMVSGRTNLADPAVGGFRVTADPALPVAGTVATALTLVVPNSGTSGVSATVTVTPNGPIPPGGLSVTLAASNGGMLGSTSLSFTGGATAAQSTTLTRSAAGTSVVTMTNTGGLTNTGSPANFTSVAAGAAVATMTLTSPTTAAAPFSVAQAFKQGDIPAGSGIVVTGATAQAVIKNAWPDGSAKIALISGSANLVAGVPATVSFASGASASGTALTTADLKAALTAAVTVDCGAFGAASWSGTDWDTPFQTWVAGHRMSSWVYRKPVGGDAHLVAWLEVRLFAGGAVEVLPWIENGYIRVASPTSKNATYSFTMGGTSRFSAAIDLPARTRTPLVSGAALSHWLGTDPGVVPKHDAAYLQSTRLVPSYRATVSPSAAVVTALPTTYTPLQLGSYITPMGGTGYQRSIGLLPEWDVLYLTTTAAAAYGGVVRNGYSAGRWGIHCRDENTNRPLRFSQFANTSVNASTTSDIPPVPTGTAAPGWDVPHHPSMGFMAYLVTGRFYFMEEVQFTATFNYLAQVDNQRSFADGVFLSSSGASTVRGAAWANRTLLQAATVTPDADTALRGEFVTSLEANINFHHSRYIAQANNPFGIVQTYGDAYGTGSDGKVTEAPWQQDFYTAAYGYMLAANPPVSSTVKTRLQAFFAWKAQSVIGRLGSTGATEWLYRDATPFTFVVAQVDNPDWITGTGPWPASWGAMYDATFTTSPGPRTAGDLRGGNFPDATSYWGNLLPAISYAVEHGVTGASAAYLRMVQAANWPTLRDNFDISPVWSVKPPVEPGVPAWLAGAVVNQWVSIAGTALSSVQPSPLPVTPSGTSDASNKINAWCGAALRRSDGTYLVGMAGGHKDYAGNEINALRLRADVPAWEEVSARTPDASLYNRSAFNADLKGAASHTYYYLQFLESLGVFVSFTNSGVDYGAAPSPAPLNPPFPAWPYIATDPATWTGGTGYDFRWSPAFDLAARTWKSPTYIPAFPSTVGDWTAAMCVKHPTTDDVYIARTGDRWRKFTAATQTWSDVSANTEQNYAGAAIDPTRSRMLVVGGFAGAAAPRVRDLSGNLISVTFGGLDPSVLQGAGMSYAGIVYDEANDRYLVVKNDSPVSIYAVDASTWAITLLSTTGTAPPQRTNGIQNSVQYVPDLGGASGIVIATEYSGNVRFLRTA